MATPQQAIDKARSQKGTTEVGFTNRVKYNDEYWGKGKYGTWAAWCVVYIWWVLKNVGMKPGTDFPITAGVRIFFQWCDKHGLIVSKNNIRPGDLVEHTYSHIGMATSTPKNGKVRTIAGNTSRGSSGSQRDGGGVWEKWVPLSTIRRAARLKWDTTSTKTASPKGGVIGMSRRLLGSHTKKFDIKGTGLFRHVPVTEDGKTYSIVSGPAQFVVNAKVDIGGLGAKDVCYVGLIEVLYKKGGGTRQGRELGVKKVTKNGVVTVTAPWTLFDQWEGRSPRLRLGVMTKAKKVHTRNVSISGVRD